MNLQTFFKKLSNRTKLYHWQYKTARAYRGRSTHRDPIWLIGSGRSGTTWVSEIINYDGRFREVFEPFHPTRVKPATFLVMHEYVRSEASYPALEDYTFKVFGGKVFHQNIDLVRDREQFEGLLVKDIYACLFAHWVAQKIPNLRIVYLIRNPFAVAISTYQTRDWVWMTNPKELLTQDNLLGDFLLGYEDLIEEVAVADDYILNQILIWCIVNGVALTQLKGTRKKIVFYEDLLVYIKDRAADLISFTRGDDIYKDHSFCWDAVLKPSKTTTKEGAFLKDSSPLSAWQSKLSTHQLEEGKKILKIFGFGNLYQADGLPDESVVANYQWPFRA